MSHLPHFKTILKKILAEKRFFLDKRGQIKSQNGHFRVARLVTITKPDGSLDHIMHLILNYQSGFKWRTLENSNSTLRNEAVRDFNLLIEEDTQELISSILELVDHYNQNPDNHQVEIGEAK